MQVRVGSYVKNSTGTYVLTYQDFNLEGWSEDKFLRKYGSWRAKKLLSARPLEFRQYSQTKQDAQAIQKFIESLKEQVRYASKQ